MEGEIPVTTPTIDTIELLTLVSARLREAQALNIETAEDLAAASDLFNEIKRERDAHERARVAEKEPHVLAVGQLECRTDRFGQWQGAVGAEGDVELLRHD